MLTRLLLALILALGAMPGPASCHGMASMPVAGAAHLHARTPLTHHDPDRAPLAADHGCIGCAALDDWLAERVAAPLPAAGVARAMWSPSAIVGVTGPPGLRPPQIG